MLTRRNVFLLSRRRLLETGTLAMLASVPFVSGCAARNARTGLPIQAGSYEATSPNGLLRITLALAPSASDMPTWEVRWGDAVLLKPAALGLQLHSGHVIGRACQVIGHERVRIEGVWTPSYGIQRTCQNRCEQLTVRFLDAESGIQFDIIVRAYDTGVALRYRIVEVPGHSASLRLAGESTHLRFPPGSAVYASRDEGDYFVSAPAGLAPVAHPDLTASCDPEPLADTPVTVRLANGFTLVLTESDRLHYPRMMFRAAKDETDTLVTHLMQFPGRATGYSGPGDTPAEQSFQVDAPFSTPWRVVIVGERAVDVIERATLVQTLATANQLGDTSWIRPGRALRSFRDNTTAAGIACVDFAVQRKLEYVEFDAHWYGDGTDPSDATVPIAGLDIVKVIEYARAKNIGVILYVDRVPAMRQLDEILRTYARWGVAGIKFGFIWEGRQTDVDWLFQVLKKCGEHRMLVNLHDNVRPAGLERTLPNYIALEGVRGNEQFPTARHNVTLPFTRNVAGPIDYTICYAHERNQTTNAHQLAMAVVYYNPLTFLYWYDKPAKYAGREWPELSFFDECPTTWDETRALAGEIGEYVVIARRQGERWFLGAMTNEQGRTLDVSLSFLGAGAWIVHSYADGEPAQPPNQTPVEVQRLQIDARTRLQLQLAPAGGQALRFEKQLSAEQDAYDRTH